MASSNRTLWAHHISILALTEGLLVVEPVVLAILQILLLKLSLALVRRHFEDSQGHVGHFDPASRLHLRPLWARHSFVPKFDPCPALKQDSLSWEENVSKN